MTSDDWRAQLRKTIADTMLQMQMQSGITATTAEAAQTKREERLVDAVNSLMQRLLSPQAAPESNGFAETTDDPLSDLPDDDRIVADIIDANDRLGIENKALRAAIDDLWTYMPRAAMADLAPETLVVAFETHEMLYHG